MLVERQVKQINVVQERRQPVVGQIMEEQVHEPLESGWSPTEPEGHHAVCKLTLVRREGSLWYRLLGQGHLAVSGAQVQATEPFRSGSA